MMVRRLPLLEHFKLAVGMSLVVAVCLAQVLSAASAEAPKGHTIDKRNVGVLARTGALPYTQGKRYMASLARSGALPVYNVHKKLHPGMTSRNQLPELDDRYQGPGEKRYVASLARTGSLPFQFQAKRDAADSNDAAVLDALDARNEQDLEKLKELEAETKALETVLYLESQLNLELLKEKLLDMAPNDAWQTDADAEGEQKRSMASLARGGNLPLQGGADKRSVEALARAGYLPATPRTMAARNDASEEPEGVGKRSVAALAKNGQLREGKRGGIGSLARNNLLPQKKSDEMDELEALIRELARDADVDVDADDVDKRNLGALAKGGGYARYTQEGKRNLAALARSRGSALREGKRYLGSLVRSQNLPLHKRDRWLGSDAKRVSPMAIAKTWNYNSEAGNSVDGIAKRYVAALLRQGRLPVGPEETATDETEAAETIAPEDKEGEGGVEAKRHISSLKGKRSVGDVKPSGGRAKREASYTDEYPMPNVQNSELFDYDDLMEVMSGSAAPEKRFLGSVARSGWFRDSTRDRGYTGLDSMGKRHIGALARLGWLPQLRSSRYRRFGRAMPSRVCKRATESAYPREDPAYGSRTQEAGASLWRTSSPLAQGRRSLLEGSPPRSRYPRVLTGENGVLIRNLYSSTSSQLTH